MTNHQRRIQQIKRRRRAALRRQRRGVLLLVVLSILVMFLLVGAAFVIVGSQYGESERAQQKSNVASPQQADLLDRAMRQLLRDTHNAASAIRYHSLLRDAYGTDGFVARVFAGSANDTSNLELGYDGTLTSAQGNAISSYAQSDTAGGVGPTQGQLVDIYVQDDLGGTSAAVDTLALTTALTPDYVIDLDLSEAGLPTNHTLSRTNDYYNGCLLTLLEGPAKGQSVRVLDYEYLATLNVARLRVVAPRRADGGVLQADPDVQNEPNDLIEYDSARGAYFGHAFMVNGRPFNGSGVGLNLLANPGSARLTALEYMGPAASPFDYAEVALMPNARYFNVYNDLLNQVFGGFDQNGAPIQLTSRYPSGQTPLYTSYIGPGGADESYDAPDYQNMFLASLPLQRVRGGGWSPAGLPVRSPRTTAAAAPTRPIGSTWTGCRSRRSIGPRW